MLRNSHCKECDLHKSAITTCLMGDGNSHADLMLIGEAPGEHEKTKPFQGKAGRRILDPLLESFDLDRGDIYITNVCKCRPPNNKKPTLSQMRTCGDLYLKGEIASVKPKKIIVMGATALKWVMNNNSAPLTKVRGDVVKSPYYPNIDIYPSYHPAAVLYDPYIKNLLYEDFKLALNGRKEHKVERHYWLINDEKEAWKLARELTCKKLALDFETTGLDVHYPTFQLLTVAICSKSGEAYCIPLSHPESRIPEKRWKVILQQLAKNNTIIGHNTKYELKCMYVNDVPWPKQIGDTLVDFYLLDEQYPSKSLFTLKKRYFPELSRAEQAIIDKKIISNLREQPLRKVAAYNCEDADATFRLAKKFKSQLRKQGLLPLSNFLMEAVKTLSRTELNGMEIDDELLESNKIIFEDKMTELERGFPQVNLNSSKQISDLLYKQYHLPVINMTDSGERGATDSDTITALTRDRRARKYHGFLGSLLEYRKVAHFYSHFLAGMENFIREDGRVHVSYNLVKHERGGKDVGTVTGRLSASLIHQIPRDTEELEKIFGDETVQIKEMFIPRFRGGCITEGDYSQIELRLLADYARDENMLDDFRSGVDIHTAVTNRLIPIASHYYSEFKEFSAKRKKTKAVNFGIVYGISPRGLGERLETTTNQAQDIIKAWFKSYPDVSRWLARMERRIVNQKEVISLIGRRRRLPGANFKSAKGREAIRQGINAVIQGLASDFQLMGMIETDREFQRRKMHSLIIATVHDSVLVDTHPREKKLVAHILKNCYENLDLTEFGAEIVVPLKLDIVQNNSWSKRGEE